MLAEAVYYTLQRKALLQVRFLSDYVFSSGIWGDFYFKIFKLKMHRYFKVPNANFTLIFNREHKLSKNFYSFCKLPKCMCLGLTIEFIVLVSVGILRK